MATEIWSNGSKWAGQEPDDLETLLAVMEIETLDPHGFHPHAFNVGHGRVHFFGNFIGYSHVFSIESDDKDVCDRLFAALRAAHATQEYKDALRELGTGGRRR